MKKYKFIMPLLFVGLVACGGGSNSEGNSATSQPTSESASTSENVSIEENSSLSEQQSQEVESSEFVSSDQIESVEVDNGNYVYLNLNGAVNWSTVYVYSWSDAGDLFDKWPGVMMTYDEEKDYYAYDLGELEITNIIFNDGNGSQTADLTFNSETPVFHFNSLGGTSGVWTAVGETVELNTSASPYYLRGDMNGWGTSHALMYTSDTTCAITIAMNSGVKFKIADANWTQEWSTLSGSAASNFSGGNGENLTCNVTGTYTFVLDLTANSVTVSFAA